MDIQTFWKQFITKYPNYQHATYTAWQFGVEPTKLAELVIYGVKTATTSAYKLYGIDNEPLPQIGDLSIVLNYDNHPMCVIITTHVYVTPYTQITERHAQKEGGGDLSLTYWKEAHHAFFIEEFKLNGLKWTEHEMMVCEEFKCLFTYHDTSSY
ncbi:ASCH domain-containing protein [Staphylococcus agnetis]|uniref:ASCH domain-containing protein n=1 Tax=Staphylococcus agnetis TaxID=985762 RepID=UPI0021D2D8B2|nr:ASCH domain-containing protein [Staphylococcus agnetis]UXU55721.1 ASCH domain-containing protein [Staphylococcus agnetis]